MDCRTNIAVRGTKGDHYCIIHFMSPLEWSWKLFCAIKQ